MDIFFINVLLLILSLSLMTITITLANRLNKVSESMKDLKEEYDEIVGHREEFELRLETHNNALIQHRIELDRLNREHTAIKNSAMKDKINMD